MLKITFVPKEYVPQIKNRERAPLKNIPALEEILSQKRSFKNLPVPDFIRAIGLDSSQESLNLLYSATPNNLTRSPS